ncbi:MAG: MFS transporter, partial [Chloroflexota bacterium]|nr:MFS transporter [Chloroflexota bacterium]
MQTAISATRRRLPLYGLLLAISISSVGNAVTRLAVPWYVLTTTGSAALTGIAAFFATLPLVLGAFFGGALADRLGFRRSSVVGDIASGAAIAGIPLLAATIGLPFWTLLVLVSLAALFEISGATARTALLVDLAEQACLPLDRVNSFEELAINGPLLVGPPLAGVLIAWLDASQVLWIDAVSFVLSAAVVLALVNASGHAPENDRGVGAGYVRGLMDGLKFVTRHQLLLSVILLNALLGLLIAMVGVGVLAGVVLYAVVGYRLPRHLLFVAAPFGLGVTALL